MKFGECSGRETTKIITFPNGEWNIPDVLRQWYKVIDHRLTERDYSRTGNVIKFLESKALKIDTKKEIESMSSRNEFKKNINTLYVWVRYNPFNEFSASGIKKYYMGWDSRNERLACVCVNEVYMDVSWLMEFGDYDTGFGMKIFDGKRENLIPLLKMPLKTPNELMIYRK